MMPDLEMCPTVSKCVPLKNTNLFMTQNQKILLEKYCVYHGVTDIIFEKKICP